jgi:Streptomyces sporulation and cell division protein, SsgA
VAVTVSAFVGRVIEAWLHGVTAVPLALAYQPTDPLAIRVGLHTCCAPAVWHVAREVIRDGLIPGQGSRYRDEPAAGVQLSTVSWSPQALLTVRIDGVRHHMTVAKTELAEFLARTYQVCPPERETALVDQELNAQLSFFYLTQNQRGE